MFLLFWINAKMSIAPSVVVDKYTGAAICYLSSTAGSESNRVATATSNNRKNIVPSPLTRSHINYSVIQLRRYSRTNVNPCTGFW